MAKAKKDDTAMGRHGDAANFFPWVAPLPSYLIWGLFILVVVGVAAACQPPPPTSTATFPPPPTNIVTIQTATASVAAAYPVASPTPVAAYPVASATQPLTTATLTPQPTLIAAASLPPIAYLPILPGGEHPSATPTLPATSTPLPTPTPTIDFAAVRRDLQAQGNDLGFAKIGFHTGIGGNMNGLGIWMQRLDAAGVPFFLKSVDNAGPLAEAQELIRNRGVPHTLVYRRSGNEYDVPDYSLTPQDAAAKHWALHKAVWPPELDPSLVWIETINEVDKNRAVWLAEFALVTAQLAMADGFKWAAFGWASGEPSLEDWQSPAMLTFLRFAAANPERVAIALHEYSYITSDIAHEYPYKVGRFQFLFQICDANDIPRPTVLITEWGWEYGNVPSVDEALADISWAARLYAPYPQIKGAAIWFLGDFANEIADQTQRLIAPVTEYSLGTYFGIPLPPSQAGIDPEQYRP